MEPVPTTYPGRLSGRRLGGRDRISRLSAFLLFGLVACLTFVWSACNGGRRYTFAVVADIQQPGDAPYRAVTGDIIREIAASDAQFVVFNGDSTSGGSVGQWEEFDKMVQPLRDRGKAIYAVIGNHDATEQPVGFVSRFPRRQVVRKPGLALVLLDSEAKTDDYNWDLGDEQTAWLRSKPWLAEDPDANPLVFFFVHRPPHRSEFFAKLDPNFRFQPEKDDIAKLLIGLGADAVFSGHEHLFSEQEFDGVPFIIAGGGGGDLLKGNYHYLLVTVYPDARKWDYQMIKVKTQKPIYASRLPFARE